MRHELYKVESENKRVSKQIALYKERAETGRALRWSILVTFRGSINTWPTPKGLPKKMVVHILLFS